jgi:hypothetical protein
MQRKHGLLFASVIMLILVACLPVNYSNASVTCTNWTLTANGFLSNFEVDNTGSNAQSVFVQIKDGAGNVIYLAQRANGTVGTAVGTIIGAANYSTAPNFNPIILEVISFAGASLATDRVYYRFKGNCEGLPNAGDTAFSFSDGRINNFDMGNPVVLFGYLYDNDTWGLDVYNADESGLLLRVSAEQITAVAECPQQNTLIVEDTASNISLWRLAERSDGTCPFQLMAPTGEAGKWYIIIFDSLYPNSYYESWEEFIGI